MKLILNILAILAAVLGAVAGLGAVPFIAEPVGLLLVALAGALLVVVKIVGDYLDNKVLDDSFKADDKVKGFLDVLIKLFKK